MSFTHTHKSDVALEFEAGKSRLRSEGQIVLRKMLNEALQTYTTEFNAAVAKGGLPKVNFSRAEVQSLLFTAAQKQLAPPVEAKATEVTDAND